MFLCPLAQLPTVIKTAGTLIPASAWVCPSSSLDFLGKGRNNTQVAHPGLSFFFFFLNEPHIGVTVITTKNIYSWNSISCISDYRVLKVRTWGAPEELETCTSPLKAVHFTIFPESVFVFFKYQPPSRSNMRALKAIIISASSRQSISKQLYT